MNKEIESISEFYNFIFPSANQIQENLLRTNLKLGRINTKYYYHANPLSKIDEVPEAKKSNIASDLILELGKSLARVNNIKEVLDIVMYQVGRIFNPLHWSLLLKDPKTGNMIFTVVKICSKGIY